MIKRKRNKPERKALRKTGTQYLLNKGRSLYRAGQIEKALACYQELMEMGMQNEQAHVEYAHCLQSLKRLDDAIATYHAVIHVNPNNLDAQFSLGCAYARQNRHAEAVQWFQKALNMPLGARSPGIHHNLGRSLNELGRVTEAILHIESAAQIEKGPMRVVSHNALTSLIPNAPSADNEKILAVRQAWARTYAPYRKKKPKVGAVAARDNRLRIGYISSFFHALNWMKPVFGLINQHDRDKFQWHLFSDGPAGRIHETYACNERDMVHDISRMDNEQAAHYIRCQGLDLLIDLNGYSQIRRLPLFRYHPAPLLAAWFNMYATSGMDSFHYIIGDAHVVPVEEEAFYTETVVRVPGTYLCFDVWYETPDIVAPPCLTHDGLTFGCLAPQYKITPEVLRAWIAILHQAQNTRLLLKSRQLEAEATRTYLLNLMRDAGIEPSRIVLEGSAPHQEFLKTYNRIDLVLDTFPYNGGTTTMEALWQGVPVLTFHGDRWVSRISASLMREAGLGWFVAADQDAYIAMAARLALDPSLPQRLAALRQGMRTRLRASPTCDTTSFARAMETLYTQLIENEKCSNPFMNRKPHR